MNECGSSSLNNCDDSATCNDLDDGFTCTCNAGYTGDGTQCDGKFNYNAYCFS